MNDTTKLKPPGKPSISPLDLQDRRTRDRIHSPTRGQTARISTGHSAFAFQLAAFASLYCSRILGLSHCHSLALLTGSTASARRNSHCLAPLLTRFYCHFLVSYHSRIAVYPLDVFYVARHTISMDLIISRSQTVPAYESHIAVRLRVITSQTTVLN